MCVMAGGFRYIVLHVFVFFFNENYFFISVLKGKVNRIQSNLRDTLEDDLKQTDYSVSALITVYIN